MHKQVLLDAKQLLLVKSWCKYSYEDARGRHCLVGAISQAAPFDQSWDTIQELRDFNNQPNESLSSFNDAPTTTLEDVLNLLDRAIEATQ